MTKFQKVQLYLSVIPGFSSIFVFLVTIFTLKRKRATTNEWLKFVAIFFGCSILASVVDTFLMTGITPALNVLVFTSIMFMANYLCVNLQISCKCRTEENKDEHQNYTQDKTVWIVAGIITFIGIVIVVICLVLNPNAQHIDDINGLENTTLAKISIDEFVSSNDHYRSSFTSYSHKGNQTKVSGKLYDVDYDQCSLKSKKFSGIHTLHATLTDHDSMILTIESTINSGNMEIIIVIDGVYYQHVTTESKQTIVLENIANKLVLVKMAAESADASIVSERKFT